MKEHHKICMVCKKPYIAKRSDGMYCGGACKEQAFLKRNGWAAPSRAQLLNENEHLKKLLSLYLNFEREMNYYFPEHYQKNIKELNIRARTLI